MFKRQLRSARERSAKAVSINHTQGDINIKEVVMKMKKSNILITLALVVFGIITLGCASHRVNLVENGKIIIERVPSKNIYVSKAHVYQEENELLITGRVKRSNTSVLDGGHVDIAVVSPEGKILDKVSTSYTPRIIRRKGSRESLFSARLSMTPPEGTTVRLAYHKLGRSISEEFDCGNSVAIPGE
jgi:YD repeat-containing protein